MSGQPEYSATLLVQNAENAVKKYQSATPIDSLKSKLRLAIIDMVTTGKISYAAHRKLMKLIENN